jgi:hypothetical protein
LGRNPEQFHLTTFGANFQQIAGSQKRTAVHKRARAAAISRKLVLKTSSWIASQNPVFSKLWFATLSSGICVAESPGVHEKSAVYLRDSKLPCSQAAADKAITKCALWPFKP